MRKLRLINAARRLDDLRVPPGNRLEALRGDRAGQWSIRINDQWRICFRWSEGGADLMSRSSTITAELLPNPRPGEILLRPLRAISSLSDGFLSQLQADHDLMARRRQIREKLKAIRPRTKAA